MLRYGKVGEPGAHVLIKQPILAHDLLKRWFSGFEILI